MSTALKVSLKAGERIYLNGAVLKTDRKVTLEFLNKVTFLLEQHVLQPEATDTPLKQLYFLVQTMLIDPTASNVVLPVIQDMFRQLAVTFENRDVLSGLAETSLQIENGRAFDALRTIRRLLSIEAEILGKADQDCNKELETCRSALR